MVRTASLNRAASTAEAFGDRRSRPDPHAELFEISLRSVRARSKSEASDHGATRSVAVRPGDTLWDVAKRHHVPLDWLFAANPQFDPEKADGVLSFDRSRRGKWDPDYLRPGDRIRVAAAHHRPLTAHQPPRRPDTDPLRSPGVADPSTSAPSLAQPDPAPQIGAPASPQTVAEPPPSAPPPQGAAPQGPNAPAASPAAQPQTAQPQAAPTPAAPPSAPPASGEGLKVAAVLGSEVSPGPTAKPTITVKGAFDFPESVPILGGAKAVVGGKVTFPPVSDDLLRSLKGDEAGQAAPAPEAGPEKPAAAAQSVAAEKPSAAGEPGEASEASDAARTRLPPPPGAAQEKTVTPASPEAPGEAGKPPASVAAVAAAPARRWLGRWPEKFSVIGSFVRNDPAQNGAKLAGGVQFDFEPGKGWTPFFTGGATQKDAVFDALNAGVKFDARQVAPGLWSAAREGVRQRSLQVFREGAAQAFAKAEVSAGTDLVVSDNALNLTGKSTLDKLGAPVAGPSAGVANVAGGFFGTIAGYYAGDWTRQTISAPLGLNWIQERAVATSAGGMAGLAVGAATRKSVEWGAATGPSLFENIPLLKSAAKALEPAAKAFEPAAKALAPLTEAPAARWAGRILAQPGRWTVGALGAAFAAGPDAWEAGVRFWNGDNAEGRRALARAAIRSAGIGVGAGVGFFFGGVGSVVGATVFGYAADNVIQWTGLQGEAR